MSDRTAPPVPKQPQPAAVPEHFAAVAAERLPWWPQATPQQRQAVLEDMALAYHADGLEPADYCQDPMPLHEHLASVAEERQRRGLPALAVQASAVPAQAEAAADKAAAEEAKAREEADTTLKATVRAFRKGEHAYRAGLLESGRLADQYLHQRMASPISDKRAPAVQTLEGELAKWSSTTVDVNRLIGCHHAYRLLAEEPGLQKAAEGVPYGHYRDAWAQLVQRIGKDTPQEHWVLLPGVEQEALALFGECAKHRRSKEAVQEGVKALLRAKVDRDAQAAQAEAERAKAAARATAEQAAQARAEAEDQARATAAAEEAARQAREADKAALTRAAEAAKAELLAKQQAAGVAAEKAVQEAAVQARALADAKAAQEAAAKAAEKAVKAKATAAEKAQRKARAEQEPAESRQPAMRAMAQAGTVKDVAGMAAELVTGHDTPDDVLAELLRQLKASGHCSKQAVRAIDAALVVLCRPAAGPVVVATAVAAGSPVPVAAVA